MEMDHQGKGDMMNKPGAQIPADRRFLQLAGFRRGFETLLEFRHPGAGKPLVGKPHELRILQKAWHCQAIEYGLFDIPKTTALDEARNYKVNHDHEGGSGRLKRQDASIFSKSSSFVAIIQHGGVE